MIERHPTGERRQVNVAVGVGVFGVGPHHYSGGEVMDVSAAGTLIIGDPNSEWAHVDTNLVDISID